MCAASHNDRNSIEVLEMLAEMASWIQRTGHGVRILAAAAAMRERNSVSVDPCDRADIHRREQLLRAALDEKSFAAEWAAGFALTVEEAIAEAIAVTLEDPA